MNESEIKAAIEKRVKETESKKYSIWIIGITEDPDRRKIEHENPKYWMQWKADTETIARSVETYFLKKEMHGGSGGNTEGRYVYIF